MNISIGGRNIPYSLRKSKKAKHLRLQISSGRLEVVIPYRISKKQAENFIIEKSAWIRKHFKEKKSNKYLYFGNEILINQSFDLFLKKHRFCFKRNILNIISPLSDSTEIQSIYLSWLKETALDYLPERTKILADENGFKINKIFIRGQKTRWGSCSMNGNVSFNFQLIQFDKKTIDYVIIHELCHTVEMNHSKKFWKLVENYCPDYKEYKKRIRDNDLI